MTLLAEDYMQSRAAFRRDAAAAGAKLECYRLAPQGETDLSVDVACLGPQAAESVVVIVAGTHGVEAYAGAACVRHLLRRDAAWGGPGVAFVLVHALNPWGFANNCRVTEENIDLNRNFVDFGAGLPPSTGYAKLHEVLCDAYVPGMQGWRNELRLLRMLLGRARRQQFQEAVSGGQYDFPDGLFYGGRAPTPNRLILDGIMARHLQPAARVRLLDLHTGLGKKAHGALISHLPDTDSRFHALSQWLGGELTSSTGGTAVSTAIAGSLPAYAEQRLGDRCHALTLEFGVAEPLPTLLALRADNWLRQRAGGVSAGLRARIDRRMCGAFLSRDPAWESAILERFSWTVERLVASLAQDGAVQDDRRGDLGSV
jgi:hypothetical protein